MDSTTKIIRTDSGVSLLNGCRLPISRISGEKAGPGPAGEKNPFFLGNRTLFNSRASPRCWRRLRLRPHTLHQGDDSKNLIGSNYESTGGLGGRRLGQRPFEPSGSFILWNIPFYLPLPGQPPPSAPKMAGIIPLVHNTTFNVRSSENCLSLPFPRQCFLFTAILLK